MTPDQPDQSGAQTARSMFAALIAGDLDNMFTFIHPEISWWPVTRPGRTHYFGHVQTRQMLEDLHHTLGRFRVEWDEFVELSDGRVVCPGQTILITDAGEVPAGLVDCLVTLRDGLIIEVESQPRSETPDRTLRPDPEDELARDS
jgi:ketosteroid isomerase-like protein